MILKATHRFLRDLEKIKSAKILDEIDFTLNEIEAAKFPQNISRFKSFKKFYGFGRIRVSDYRIGVQYTDEIIILKCLLHCSIIYRNFPR